MSIRKQVISILNYQPYDQFPVLHFGFWAETLELWTEQGHIPQDIGQNWGDGNLADAEINRLLGFDSNYNKLFAPLTTLSPAFECKVIKEFPDGLKHVLSPEGAVILEMPNAGSIPAEVDHLLKDRKSWEELYLPKLQFTPNRVNTAQVYLDGKAVAFDQEGKDLLLNSDRTELLGLYCGSLFGVIRNWLGIEGVSYLYVDDEPLFDEMINTVGDLCYKCAETTLATGTKFDFGHFWEDICFKSGPLVNPTVFAEKVGPYYKRITDLLHSYNIDIVSLDCDGLVDSLIPTWLENGVNTMFPIEVGTWHASIKPWREKFGQQIRGVGGMNKNIFAEDYRAIDREIERLKPLVELGGYIPCPDHRIPPDAKWENVQYYCETLRNTFG